MPRMPFLLRSVLRALPVVLLVTLAACLPAFGARPADMEVTITKPDGSKEFVLTSAVANPDINAKYTVRQADGTTQSVQVQDGISIRALLAEAEAELGYAKIEFPKPGGGGVVSLTRKQVDSILPPVLYADEAGTTWFLRAPTSATDVNAGDHFALPASTLELEEVGAVLTVKVKASRARIDPGESVRFTASVSGGPADADYTYDWVFGDGEREDDGGKTVTHRFEEEGNYKVVVGVSIDDAERSDPGTVRVQVGDPKQSDEDREGGGDNGAAGAPDSGSTTGSDGSATYTPSYTPPATPTPLPPAPTTPPTPTPAPPEPPKPPDIPTSGTTVEGNLLADVSDPPPSNILESAARAARDGNPKDDAPDGADVPEAALSIAGVLALLGLGAGIETRQGRLPRLRRPRLALPRRGA
jgi:plastocyanin